MGDETQPEEGRPRLRELGQYIRQQRYNAELSLRHLAKLAGVSNPYLSQIERGLRKPSAEILQAIAKALSISSETLYVKAGILEERDDDHDLEACIARDSHLNDNQRQVLTEMYRSFRQLSEYQQAGEPVTDQRRGAVQRLVDVVSTGAVDDASIAAASPPAEEEQAG